MTIDQLREVFREKPFRPFHLQLADGIQVPVTHPECVSYHPEHPRSISVALPSGAFKIIDLLLVGAIHIENGKTA